VECRMPYQLNEKHVAAAFASGRVPHPKGLVPMKTVQIGNLVVTSQSVLAMDPVIPNADKPFTQRVPNGRHPVTVAIADFADFEGDERIAFARVEFSLGPPVTWRMALKNSDKDPASLGPGQFIGYGVDGGLGCFLDFEAAGLIGQRYQQEGPYFAFGDLFVDELERTYRHTRNWAVVRPIEEREENIICFSSGYGDGAYPSFFGFDANGEVCQLVTDFLIFVGQTGQRP
jgi:hypothetical protein